MQTAMFMTASGLKTKLKVLANIYMQTVLYTRVTGSMISKMDRAKKNGRMVLLTKGST